MTRSTVDRSRWLMQPVQAADRMTVAEWHHTFLQPYLQKWTSRELSIRNSIDQVLYLTDIDVAYADHVKLRRCIPSLGDCDESGRFTLNRFVQELHGPHIAIPDMAALLYLSPPTDGCVFTPFHYDGHGSQTSVHAVLFGGPSNHNLIFTFPVSFFFCFRCSHLTPRRFDRCSACRRQTYSYTRIGADLPHSLSSASLFCTVGRESH
jgi:hypothetical protein